MPKSYRIRTQPGVDSSLKIQLEQDFDFLEILSLKINQGDIYTRICSDYGVIVGRVLVNGGYGVPNAKVSVFIPISEEDQLNPVISELYPYTSLSDVNEDGYRYNLLPYRPSYQGHAATGTFPDREDVLIDSSLVEVYDKYYKFTVKTNESGDYMIFGVPTGTQTVVMDVDLSDIGCFSLSPQDLIRTGLATESQVNGSQFKTSTNLNELPQIITLNKIIDVNPLWGEPEVCLLGITRTDFDLTSLANISIQPTAIFMGSIVSTADEDSIKINCKPKLDTGNMCDLITGPGEILAIRQTIGVDVNGDPILEEFTLEQNGKVIDENGTWLVDVPMNLDYVTTNEFGEQILSNDPSVGIPTKGKYRFKVRWQSEGGLQNNFLRGNYLVPNVKEYGWSSSSIDPFDPSSTAPVTFIIPIGLTATTIYSFSSGGLIFDKKVNTNSFSVEINGIPYFGDLDSIPVNTGDDVTIISNPIDITQPQNINFTFFPADYYDVLRSYAFSLEWNDYVNKQDAIDCKDTFYLFNYNKVYTVASFIDRYKNGKNRARHLGIKEITDRACQSENNKFPVNDLQRNFDAIYFVVNILLQILSLPMYVIIAVAHIVYKFWPYFVWLVKVILPVIITYNIIMTGIALVLAAFPVFNPAAFFASLATLLLWVGLLTLILVLFKGIKISDRKRTFPRIGLPMITYNDCELCECKDKKTQLEEIDEASFEDLYGDFVVNSSFLADVNISTLYSAQQNTYSQILDDDPDTAPSALAQFRQILSGIDQQSFQLQGSTSFITKDEAVDDRGYPLTETLPQKLNSFNLRDKYFQQTNIIQTNVNGTGTFSDQPLVVLVDWSVIEQFQSGDLVTFQNPDLSGDINRITGLTTNNQFGTQSITGTTTTGTSIPILIEYANPNDPTYSLNLTTTVLINQTTNNQTYKFPADLEYFQVITGLTVQNYIQIAASIGAPTNSFSFRNECLYHRSVYRYHRYNASDSSPNPSNNKIFEQDLTPLYFFQDYQNLGVLIFTRGVDPYTDKQSIEYNLTKIFGGSSFSSGTQIKVSGQFKLNYPIRGYNDGRTPSVHNTINNQPSFGTTRGIYNKSFTFTPDTTLFGTYTNTNSTLPYYYLSTDKNNSGILNGTSYKPEPSNPTLSQTVNNITSDFNLTTYGCYLLPYNNMKNKQSALYQHVPNSYPYYVGGGTYLVSNSIPKYDLDCDNSDSCNNDVTWYLYSPSYIGYYLDGSVLYNLPGVNFDNPLGIIMRSDRLPTSTSLKRPDRQVGVTDGTMLALHQNYNFTYYLIPEEGFQTAQTFENIFSSETNGNIDDNISGAYNTSVTNTLTCAGMVEIKCYQGYGTGITINQSCVDTDKVENGCYYLINQPYIDNIDDDFKLFLEWKTRFLINYGACRGVFGHMFQNNWINGVLYMPSFNKTTFFDIFSNPKYQYCDDVTVFNEIDNNFYYRSSPYNGTDFIGMGRDTDSISNGSNSKQILFPTTITDLGNRDEIIGQICGNSNFSGKYLAKTFKHSSYNDSTDVLLFSILSRLLNSKWWDQILNTGSGSIQQFFDARTGSRIDGDIAQSFSINSEFEINPFIEGNYPDNQIFIGQYAPGKPVFGVFYDLGETDDKYKNRRSLSPGYFIYNINPLLQNYFGYPGAQEVPLYKWKLNSTGTIFGDEKNNWLTTSNQNAAGTGFFSKKYQDLDASTDPYFSTPLSNPRFGFLTNFDNLGNPIPSGAINQQQFLVGAPNHFYFGLKQGASALNRFIKLYINTNIE